MGVVMKNEKIEREISDLELFIRLKQDDIDSLIACYGDGVRPAWVGEEIGIDMANIQYARSQIEKLKAEMAQ
jgi:hypothetical protein